MHKTPNFHWNVSQTVDARRSLMDSISTSLSSTMPYELSKPLLMQFQKAVLKPRQEALDRFNRELNTCEGL